MCVCGQMWNLQFLQLGEERIRKEALTILSSRILEIIFRSNLNPAVRLRGLKPGFFYHHNVHFTSSLFFY